MTRMYTLEEMASSSHHMAYDTPRSPTQASHINHYTIYSKISKNLNSHTKNTFINTQAEDFFNTIYH